MGNPLFEDSGDMLALDTKVVMNKYAIRTVNAVEEIGQRQFSESVEDRLKIASNKPLSDIVSKNKLALLGTPQTKQRSRSKEQVASLKTHYTLLSRFTRVEFLSIRNICLPRSISAACRRELRDPIEDRKVHRCHVQQKVFSQWGK